MSHLLVIWLALSAHLASATLKDVFAHYLLGGMTAAEAVIDVQEAQALGIDAFAVDIQNTIDDWAVDAIGYLFDAAEQNDFKLFFSFDMAVQSEVSYFLDTFRQYVSSSAYYTHNNLPFVSTFNGATLSFGSSTVNEGWQTQLRDALSADDIEIFFLPAFGDAPDGPTDFFPTYPVVDGVFCWDCAWPWEADGIVNVSTKTDQKYFSGAQNAEKTYMMAISPVQFKHLEKTQNWYRKGELNMALRIGQVLDLAPDFIEIITWNDCGESHNIGNCWPESISGSLIPGYTDGYVHTGWQSLIPPLVKAFKAGVTDLTEVVPTNGSISGAFWYRPLLATASCSQDTMGKPDGANNAEDGVSIALFMIDEGNTVTVKSGGSIIGTYDATKGSNSFWVPNLQTGAIEVAISSKAGELITSASSSVDVVADTTGLCIYNYQVVAMSA